MKPIERPAMGNRATLANEIDTTVLTVMVRSGLDHDTMLGRGCSEIKGASCSSTYLKKIAPGAVISPAQLFSWSGTERYEKLS